LDDDGKIRSKISSGGILSEGIMSGWI